MVDLEEIPRIFGGESLFISAFQKAELANLSREEREGYEASLKVYRDLKGVIDSAREEGEQIGLEKGEQIGLEKGEQIGLEKALQLLIASGMTEAQARELLKMTGNTG